MSTLKRKANGPLSASDAKKPKQNASITSFFAAPKTTPASGATTSSSPSSTAAPAASAPAHPPAVSFNKQKWVEKLTNEQRELLKLEIDTLDESWLALLKDEITTKEFLDLKRFLDREANAGKKVFPPREDVYSWYVNRRASLPSQADICVTMFCCIEVLTCSVSFCHTQVPPYALPHSQGRNTWPRSLPQYQSGPWACLLSATTD